MPLTSESKARLERPSGVSHAIMVVATTLAATFAASGRAAGTADKLDFNFQVRPILSDRCFKCHGPDEKARKAKLRLDLPESAYAIRDAATGKRALLPRHPEQS